MAEKWRPPSDTSPGAEISPGIPPEHKEKLTIAITGARASFRELTKTAHSTKPDVAMINDFIDLCGDGLELAGRFVGARRAANDLSRDDVAALNSVRARFASLIERGNPLLTGFDTSPASGPALPDLLAEVRRLLTRDAA